MEETVSINLERVQRAATLLMYQNLNTQITAENTLWAARDTAFHAALGRSLGQYAAEQIPAANFYAGHIPSLIQAPLHKYPNCACLAYLATPQRTDDDWGEKYILTMAVELMVKSEVSEEEVNSRVHRTVDAAHAVLTSDSARRLPEGNSGEPLVWQLANTPAISIGDVFIRHEGTDPNARWYWQGGRLEYAVERYMDY